MAILNLIPTEKIIERLRYENPWWITKEIPNTYSSMSKRLYFDLFYPFVVERSINRALALMGPRRVGKTVMLFHCIENILKEGTNPHKLFFIGIENPIYVNLSLEDILTLCKDSPVLVDDKSYKPVWGVEIKWSNRYFGKPQELKNLIKFCETNKFESAVVTSIDPLGMKEILGLKFTFLPASIYAYNIGEITLKTKNKN